MGLSQRRKENAVNNQVSPFWCLIVCVLCLRETDVKVGRWVGVRGLSRGLVHISRC